MIVDVRGQACPIPVIKTRKALDGMDEGTLEVLLDNATSADNVARTAGDLGCAVERTEEGGAIRLRIEKSPAAREPAAAGPREVSCVAYVNTDRMGEGEEELGRLLMKAFLQTLKETAPRAKKAVFVNAGVRLTTAGSEHIDTLRALEALGVDIVSCGTCLDYYGLTEDLEVGRSSNMFEIVETLSRADRVVRP